VVEAGDILAGEVSVRWCFANGPNKNLTVWSDVNTQFIAEYHLCMRPSKRRNFIAHRRDLTASNTASTAHIAKGSMYAPPAVYIVKSWETWYELKSSLPQSNGVICERGPGWRRKRPAP
jgi:hypothetical protein